ncbi:hypothetical protein O3M35_004765 [Rhynocoris fuscipes]|uniref:Uncharacterized protein n=1 Tax=Rhynocoris fuscipes TaxID=488301 RepID=A0AAW1DGB3_9HEMI
MSIVSVWASLVALFYILVIISVFSFIWTCLLVFYFNIRIGESPIGALHIGYKYNYLRRSSTLFFKHLSKQYTNYKLVKLCYSGIKASHVEYANGIIVSESDLMPDVYMLDHMLRTGLTLFKIPNISHAISVKFPTIPWVPLTRSAAVAVAYPRLFQYVKDYNLCAYPVLEIYERYSITIMIPLVRQDEFVVKEAERLVNGRQYSAMLSPVTSIIPQFVPLKSKPLKKVSSARLTKGERKG